MHAVKRSFCLLFLIKRCNLGSLIVFCLFVFMLLLGFLGVFVVFFSIMSDSDLIIKKCVN